jgi:chromate reductase, NAD(P)H dehydrogenase (quinone)
MTVTLIGITGSLRKASLNTALLRAAVELAPAGITLETATLHGIPLYDGDVEAGEGIPAPVVALAERMQAAAGVLIVSPEYNYGIPGGLKNAVDWLSRVKPQPFQGKPTGILGASPGRLGTARMQYQLRQVLLCLDARVLNRPEVMVAGATTLIDGDGRLTDEPTRRHVAALVEALAKAAG